MSQSPGGLSKGFKVPTAPEEGSFPLDHFGECTHAYKEYMACMQENGHTVSKCRDVAASYMKCRMENDLMEKKPLYKLGLSEKPKPEVQAEAVKVNTSEPAANKEPSIVDCLWGLKSKIDYYLTAPEIDEGPKTINGREVVGDIRDYTQARKIEVAKEKHAEAEFARFEESLKDDKPKS